MVVSDALRSAGEAANPCRRQSTDADQQQSRIAPTPGDDFMSMARRGMKNRLIEPDGFQAQVVPETKPQRQVLQRGHSWRRSTLLFLAVVVTYLTGPTKNDRADQVTTRRSARQKARLPLASY